MNMSSEQQRLAREGFSRILHAVAAGEIHGNENLEAWAEGLAQAMTDLSEASAREAVESFAESALLASDIAAHLRNTLAQYALLGHSDESEEAERRAALISRGADASMVSHAALQAAAEDCAIYGHLNAISVCARCGFRA
jgi:hypothetical protein